MLARGAGHGRAALDACCCERGAKCPCERVPQLQCEPFSAGAPGYFGCATSHHGGGEWTCNGGKASGAARCVGQ